jgi:hypothetical protein
LSIEVFLIRTRFFWRAQNIVYCYKPFTASKGLFLLGTKESSLKKRLLSHKEHLIGNALTKDREHEGLLTGQDSLEDLKKRVESGVGVPKGELRALPSGTGAQQARSERVDPHGNRMAAKPADFDIEEDELELEQRRIARNALATMDDEDEF